MRRYAPLALVLLSGCGTAGADLMVVDRSGSIAGAELHMRVIDDGQVECNGSMHDLGSDELIEAREVERELAEQATGNVSLPPGPGAILRFRIRTEDGLVGFSDTSPRQPQIFYRAAQLVRTIAKGACGLER
ncbi:MAG: hypothetical protein ACJ762_01635 [Solirubrobacteraceae bacterium]